MKSLIFIGVWFIEEKRAVYDKYGKEGLRGKYLVFALAARLIYCIQIDMNLFVFAVLLRTRI